MTSDLFPKNAFDGVFNIKSDFSQIDSAINLGDLEEARTLLDDLIKDDSDPTKRYYLSLIYRKLKLVDEEEQDVHFSEYHGTNIAPYLAIETKLRKGLASNAEYKELLTFWHSYPSKRLQYRLDIFKYQVKYNNLSGINPELIWILVEYENRPEFKYFYMLFARYNGYIDSYRLRGLRKGLSSRSRLLGKEMYFNFRNQNVLPNML